MMHESRLLCERYKYLKCVCSCTQLFIHKHTRSSSTYRTLNIITMVLSMPVLSALILERITTLGVKFNTTYIQCTASYTHNQYYICCQYTINDRSVVNCNINVIYYLLIQSLFSMHTLCVYICAY